MNAAVSPGLPWSPQQQQWLSALGYTLYVSADAVPATTGIEAEQTPPPVAVERPAAPVRRQAPAMETSSPPSPAVTRAPTPRMRPASRLPDRLHFALIRASGCNPNAEGAAELFAQWPSSAELRGNPAAKRALWPTLRALRRQAKP